jgi:hypothetical protein
MNLIPDISELDKDLDEAYRILNEQQTKIKELERRQFETLAELDRIRKMIR